MLWFFFALLATVIWSASNLIDDDFVLHRLKDPNVLVGMTGLFAGIPALFLCLAGLVSFDSPQTILFGLGIGVLNLLVYYPYFRALETTHPANVVVLWHLNVIFVAIFAFIFLGERLSLSAYIAILLILLGAIIVETAPADFQKRKMERRAFWWMMLALVGATAEAILIKFFLSQTPTTSGIGLMFTGSFLVGTLFFFSKKNRTTFKRAFIRSKHLLLLNELLEILAVVFSQLAISLGPVSLVTAIGGSQALFVLLFSIVASRLFTKKQFRIAKTPPAIRIIFASMIIIIGLYVIS